ncbi:cupin domain-containing protein (plasmid) [Microvirga sp. RSM25]|uniref:cupin domain-containing protein n=1 Tax=Microvirga sp. RSM25 TaxID=3273802 RepID=UPI0038500CF8
MNTLSAILDALGTTLLGFFSTIAGRSPYSPFYSADDLVEIGNKSSVSYRMIGINHPNRDILMLHETYAIGAKTGGGCSHAAQEAGIVIEGDVEVTVGAEVRVLNKGDAYYFDSRVPHSFRNVANQKSQIISTVSVPSRVV